MGVQARIVLYARDSSDAEAAARAAFARIEALDAVMSDYRDDSEIMKLGRSSVPVKVSDDLWNVLVQATTLSRRSDGAFDVTVGPLVALWRQARRQGALPSTEALEKARARVGWSRIRLDEVAHTALASGMQLDLGGIAKGYAADRALEVLRSCGVERAMIEFGGDIVAGDAPPGTAGWKVAVPLADSTLHEVVLRNEAVSTSGDTQQFVVIGGTRYSHVVDPHTGIGLTSRIAVTVVAPSGAVSDALATTLSVLGPVQGRKLIRRWYPDVRASFRFVDE